MVFSTDVASHFNNLDTLKTINKHCDLEPKDSLV